MDDLEDFISDEMIDEGGKLLWRTRIRVGAVIFDDAQRVLMVRQTGDLWVLPGGRIKQGETISDGLRREVREETGLQVEPVRLLWFRDGISEEYRTLYIEATFVAEPVRGSMGKGERDCRYYSRDEIARINASERLKDELWLAVESSKSYDPAQLRGAPL